MVGLVDWFKDIATIVISIAADLFHIHFRMAFQFI